MAEKMKWRELAGAINHARTVYVFVCWGDGEGAGDYYAISKESARSIAQDAREAGVEVCARLEKGGKELLIGDEHELDGDDDEIEEEEEENTEEEPAEEEEEPGEEETEETEEEPGEEEKTKEIRS